VEKFHWLEAQTKRDARWAVLSPEARRGLHEKFAQAISNARVGLVGVLQERAATRAHLAAEVEARDKRRAEYTAAAIRGLVMRPDLIGNLEDRNPEQVSAIAVQIAAAAVILEEAERRREFAPRE